MERRATEPLGVSGKDGHEPHPGGFDLIVNVFPLSLQALLTHLPSGRRRRLTRSPRHQTLTSSATLVIKGAALRSV